MNNQACKARPEIINISSNNPAFYPFSIKTSKCSGSCNNINDPYTKICVLDVVKDLNVKVRNLMSRSNERRLAKCHETCKCICRLDANVCNNKHRWNNDLSFKHSCRCECKEFIDKGACDKGYAQNPSNCEYECDNSCDIGEYLDYENCKCRKRVVDKLVKQCIETIEEVKLAKLTHAKIKSESKCSFCIVYIVLFWIFFTTNVGVIRVINASILCFRSTIISTKGI